MRGFRARKENVHTLCVKRYLPVILVASREDTYWNVESGRETCVHDWRLAFFLV